MVARGNAAKARFCSSEKALEVKVHTAFSLNSSMFGIEVAGRPADRETVLDWQMQDRLGVVVSTPLGGLGASMLMQLAITAYYDARPSRRHAPHYAEIYVFHLGGRYGDFTSLDVAPPRREIFLNSDPASLVEAINDRAITHLAVPDAPTKPLNLPWSEVEAARDRIRHCYAYDPGGRTASADVAISSNDPATLTDVEMALYPQRLLKVISSYIETSQGTLRTFTEASVAKVQHRLNEVTETDRAEACARRDAISISGLPRETYRRMCVDDALGMLAV